MWNNIRAHSNSIEHSIETSKFIAAKWRFLNAFITECWDKALDDAEKLSQSSNVHIYVCPLKMVISSLESRNYELSSLCFSRRARFHGVTLSSWNCKTTHLNNNLPQDS